MKSLQPLNYVFVTMAIYTGFEIGDRLATIFYYDVFNYTDPYFGSSTFRIILSSFCSGVLSCFLGIIYTEIFKVKNNTRYFVIAYVSIIFLLVGSNLVMDGFPSTAGFWLFRIGVLTMTAFVIVFTYSYIKLIQSQVNHRSE